MSGALTTGDKLTGGTSGATGIVESVTTEGSATITGITKQILLLFQCLVVITLKTVNNSNFCVGGMTDEDSGFFTFTVHNA